MAIGIGISPVFKKSGINWVAFWAHQSEVLFFGLYSEISGGQMPNKVTGATDFLTVAGVAGSETYQCPNTAAYIAADTDYIWFKTDTTQRTTTTAELIGYDFPRTPIKYNDTAPNAIVAIMILNAAVTGTKRDKMFQDFWLPILWDNNLNAFGHIKSNRVGQTLWTPESVMSAGETAIRAGNTVAWYDSTDLTTITKDAGTGEVTEWRDKLLSGNDILGAGGAGTYPIWSATGILLDGSDDYLKSSAFAYIQPEFVYMVVKQVTWTAGDYFFDGNASVGGIVYQNVSPQFLYAFAGAEIVNSALAINTWGIIRVLFNGINSKFTINNGVPTTGDTGGNNMGGFTLGSNGSLLAGHNSNIEVKEIVLRNKIDTVQDEADIYDYLKTKYGL